MKRLLCYNHHKSEFDKLPNALRGNAVQWRTVLPAYCELCNRQDIENPPSYIIIEGDPVALEHLLDELTARNYLDSEFDVRHIRP